MQTSLDQPLNSLPATRTRPTNARAAVKLLFFLNGALFASWASRIPAVQAQRGLGNGSLGLALLSIALGAVISMPLSGLLMARFGSDRICKYTAILYAAMLPAIVLAPNLTTFIIALFFFGASHGGLDVAMNAQAVDIEKRYGEPIMSSFHALWSTGGLAGAATAGLLAGQGVRPLVHFAIVALLFGAALTLVFPHLLSSPAHSIKDSAKPQPNSTLFSLPSKALLTLGTVALCIMVGEGAMADWSAVYLRNNIGTRESLAAVGYATFSIAMAVGRFLGDRLTSRFGPANMVRLSGGLAAGGLSLALLSGNPAIALIGFGLVGLGFSTVVPIVFTAAGNTPGVPSGVALASVSSLGYLGFLIGPPFIGFAAQFLGLRSALGIIILASLTAVLLAPAVRPRKTSRVRTEDSAAPTPHVTGPARTTVEIAGLKT
ncbi:MAG: transporter [Pedosphaera sp.]|nr:transporter [Pedosphaera sp.]